MFYEIYGGEGPPGRPDIPPSADTPESCVEQQQRRASPPDSDVCPSHSGESAATVIPGPQWRPRRAGASRGVRRLPVGAALARGKLRVGGARNKRNRESPEATESEAKVSDETSEESADTSDSEEETESSEQASSGSSDEEGDASGSKRLWQPSKAYSAAAKAALLKERDPWFAACAVDGDFSNDSENEEPLMDVVDKVEEALEVAANCAVSAATANDAPAVDARRKSVQSPFYVKVRSELEKIQELQTKPVKLQQQGAHEEQVSHCVLHDYQTEGVAWILQRFAAHLNCIVADDMGLGKTLQALAVYLHLCRFGGSAFAGKPAIVVCPLSVISSWVQHCTHFLGAVNFQQLPEQQQQQQTAAGCHLNAASAPPGMSAFAESTAEKPLRLLVFVGDSPTRADIKQKVLAMQRRVQQQQHVAAPTAAPFDILLTSYELAAREMSFVSSFCFSLLIADEASRLKGPHGVKRRLLAEGIKRQRTLLLTGTPIENSLLELFSLLSFLHPSIFSSAEAFTSLFYAECENRLPGSKASLASSPNRNCQLLERVVSAFVLRRTVMQAQHCWQLPPLREVILMLPLTPVQRRLYLWLLTRDAQLLLSSSHCGASDIIKGIRNLNNLYMQLRKASNHPLLFARKQSDTLPFMQASSAAASGPRNATAPKSPSEFSTDDEEEDFCYEELLLSASNKLQALHRIVSLCISRGEKLVIYSHSTKMLDITEDLLLESGIRPARLDGDTPDAGRRAAIEAFLKPPPTTQKSDDDEGTEWTPMVLLMSVLAGGYGLNLVSSSSSCCCRCCVFLEGGGGGNPQVERQAIARLHRQGQTRPVVAIRLISKHTVEEVLYRRGNAKLHLSSVVLGAAEAAATPRGTAGAKEASATAAADPLRSLQAFDCGALLTSNAADNGNLEHDAPQKQHSQLAKSLRFGAAALIAADTETNTTATSSADTNVLESFPIEAILTDALSTAAAGAAPSAGVLPAATVSSSSPGASPPLLSSPPASAPAAHVVEVQSQDDRAKSPPAGDNIYVFEQKDFTPFVRADRRQEDDVTALESLAMANARAPPDTFSKGRRGLTQEAGFRGFRLLLSWIGNPRLPEETPEARRLRLQRVFRLERLWESQGYMSHALRFSGETDPRYIWGLDASGAAEATASGSPEGKTPTEPRRQIPAETFFVFPSLCDKEDSSDALPTKNSRPKGSSSYCHQRIGDATCPQSVLGAPPGPQVICLFVETGGRWLSRGFFAAIDRLSSEPRKVFTQAHKCRDVRGGDVHLVKIREGLFVALAVCINEENRNRKGGGGFFVRVRDMMRCLDLLSLHCKMNAASLHLPRCNTPCRYSADANTNSLTTNALVFRLLQETFARRKVHALTYILPRRGNPADNVGCRNGVGRTSSIPSADTGVPPKTALVRSALGPCAAERGSNGSVGSPEGDGDCCASGATQVQATKQKAPKGWCALRKKQRADAQTKQQPQPTQHGLTQKKSPQLQVKQEQQQAWKVPQRGEQTQPVSREPALSGSSSTAGGSAQSSSERSKADKNEVGEHACGVEGAPCMPIPASAVLHEEVLELTREAVEMDVLHAAFGRLVASLAAVVETDEQLSQMARAWGVQQVLVQLPWARTFFPVCLRHTYEKGGKGVDTFLATGNECRGGRRLIVRIEFSDFGEAAAASGCAAISNSWLAGLREFRPSRSAATGGESFSKCTPTFPANEPGSWEQICHEAKRWMRAEACEAAAMASSLERTPISLLGGPTERVIPSNLRLALFAWENANHAKQRPPTERSKVVPSDPLLFYGVHVSGEHRGEHSSISGRKAVGHLHTALMLSHYVLQCDQACAALSCNPL
ncbi:uncharacterized protein LOC34622046 [Cyclospora cayetanensis]|uniref:Uncharacterized protein LOC34622046 n=1 Tax=Cyclospora cayetanensis TaxID=88456 RepID=A0A6P6RR53_9EIME|nr:uncharacterized protein LOC34622046 [Cyclospora cayetanensis]